MATKDVLSGIQSGSNSINNVGNTVTDVKNSINNSISGAANIASSIASLPSAATSTLNDALSGIAGVTSAVNGVKNIGSTISNASNIIADAGMAAGAIGNVVESIVPANAQSILTSANNGANSLTWPETLKNVTINPAHINFQFYERKDKANADELSTSINLPMPDDVRNPSTINWDNGTDFGMMGDALVKGLKNIQAGEGSVGGLKEQLGGMTERVKSLAFYTGVANLNSKAMLGGENLSANDFMGAVSSKMPNPYKTMLFRGVDFRKFTFVFNFVPFSEDDCQTIYKIIEKFRYHSYPAFATQKMFFTYPDECEISYMWESGHNKWLNNFKRAVCTSVDVDYAPNGQWTSLRNGFPSMIRLTTSWTEVKVLTKEDIVMADNKGQRS
jgi:hypothetical protein